MVFDNNKIEECPYGAIGTKTIKEGYYRDVSDKKAPKDEITAASGSTFDNDPITINIANCPSLPVDASGVVCRYESIQLTGEMSKDDIRNEIKKSGIVHDIAVELADDVSKLSDAKTLTLYYILDPLYIFVILFLYSAVVTSMSNSLTISRNRPNSNIPVFRECCGKYQCNSGRCISQKTRSNGGNSVGIDPLISPYGLDIENGQIVDSGDTCPIGIDGLDNCVCKSGYAGPDCKRVCTTGGNVLLDCNNHGVCNNNGVCECEVGYGGNNYNCSLDIIPVEGNEEDQCNGNGEYSEGNCICYEGFTGNKCNESIIIINNYNEIGKCPKGPIQVDLRCETVEGDPPQISFTFVDGKKYTVSMNGKYSHNFEYDDSDKIDETGKSIIKSIYLLF